MHWRFGGSSREIEELRAIVAELPEIQRTLVSNHHDLLRPDRAAHQQQVGAGVVRLDVETRLPEPLDGVGILQPGTSRTGIGRISTGLGCPHLETDPDFLGLMVAFQTTQGERVDLLAINDPAAPTDTAEEFIALLAATGAAAGAGIPFGDAGELDLGNFAAGQAKLFNALRKRVGLTRATSLYLHIARQTARTALSSTAVQTYWTGVVETGGVPGKFSFVPTVADNPHRTLRPGGRHLSEDWRDRLAAGSVVFGLRWIPFHSEEETPLETPTRPWSEAHAVSVGSVTFLPAPSDARQERLIGLLAAQLGANPGNWVGVREGRERPEFAATTFTAARQLAYALSQETRGALPPEAYRSFFENGSIGEELAAELERRAAEP